MATEVFIADSNVRAKIRNPWGVLGLSLITLGIYGIFWWYFINRELRDLGRAKGVSGLGDNPGLSTAAYALSGFTLGISAVWTLVTTTIRVHRGQVTQGYEPFSGWIAAVVYILTLGIGIGVFLQYQMNRIWEQEQSAPPPGLGSREGDTDLERLSKLNELKASGAISDEEFEAEKEKVLRKRPSAASLPASPNDPQTPPPSPPA